MANLKATPRRSVVGAPPGTISPPPGADTPRMHLIAYDEDSVEERDVASVQELEAARPGKRVLWLNVDGVGDADTIAGIGKVFDLHPLSLEDVAHLNQRAKIEEYGDVLFMVCRMITGKNVAEEEQLSIFLGDGFVVTFQERKGDCLEPVRERIRKGNGRVRRGGADYLAYALIDAVVDNYFPILEAYGDRIDALAESAAAAPEQKTLLRTRDLKRELQALRHAVWPLRDALGGLHRESFPHIKDETMPYLRDCLDHTVRVIELLEIHREQCTDLVNLYMSSISNRMNEIMRILTIIATIFIPLTFIAGIYGMNFDPQKSPWNMPELGWYWGYPVALGMMVVCAIGLLAFFKRKKWL